MSLFMSSAFAAAANEVTNTGAHPDATFSWVMMIAIFVVFYLLIIRPQHKRTKEHRALIAQIKVGDEVITLGGMLAKISAVDEQYIKVTIADGVDIKLQRSAISSVLPKGTIKSV